MLQLNSLALTSGQMSPSSGKKLEMHICARRQSQVPTCTQSMTRLVLSLGLFNHAIHVISAATYSHTSVNTLHYVKAGKQVCTVDILTVL